MIFGKHINRYYLKYSWILLLGILALVMVDYFQLKVPELYRILLECVNGGGTTIDGEWIDFSLGVLLDTICLPLIFIILIMVVGRFLWRVCFFGSAIRVETDIRRRMFDHAKELSQEFYQVNKVGNLMSLFTNDLETIQECFGDGILMFFDALLLGGLAIYKMVCMNPLLALLSCVPMILLFCMSLALKKSLMLKWDKRQAAFSDLSDFAQETFSGLSVIKAFVKETKELLVFKKLNKNNEDCNVDYVKLSTLMNVLVTLLVESVVCIILGYGGYLVYTHVFTAPQLLEYIGYFTSVTWPVMAISQLIEMRSRGKASLLRIEELLDAPIHVHDVDVTPLQEPLKGAIEFRHLTFSYKEKDYPSLDNLTFSIQAGENIGIIGKTGSGKTTLVDLILRTYNVEDGTLFLDGIDINRIPIEEVRRYAAYVPQDNFLFSDTIKNNIAFATVDEGEPDLEAVIHAAKMADVDSNIVEFRDGYDTYMGERGVTVSGGQKQRISIARALMKNAAILILDDSVSAVDTATEKVILDNLKKERAGKTTILIAHRVTTICQMDKVLFLDEGKLIAFDSHEELLRTCPEYLKMVELQKLEEAKEGTSNA